MLVFFYHISFSKLSVQICINYIACALKCGVNCFKSPRLIKADNLVAWIVWFLIQVKTMAWFYMLVHTYLPLPNVYCGIELVEEKLWIYIYIYPRGLLSRVLQKGTSRTGRHMGHFVRIHVQTPIADSSIQRNLGNWFLLMECEGEKVC